MKNRTIQAVVVAAMIITGSCAPTQKIEDRPRVGFSIHGGMNVGGITENTDMSVVPDAVAPPEAIVDAFTGATNTGYHAGAGAHVNIRRLQIEAGLDYMRNSQSFNYIDAGKFYIGQRDLRVDQYMIPVTLNFPLMQFLVPRADMRLKLGYVSQFNRVKVMDMGVLPEYKVYDRSGGPIAGISVHPFHFSNGSALGFYVDVYRGSQMYEDPYNRPEFEMPGSSFFRTGITYTFR